MVIPSGYTEEQVMEITTRVVKKIAGGFAFGYYEEDDMEQESFIELIERALPKYNGNHPLENFLSSHLKRRLINFKRDKFHRNDPPCLQCPLGAYVKSDKSCKIYDRMLDCEWYSPWKKRNMSKQNLMQPAQIDDESFIGMNPLSGISEEEMKTVLDAVNRKLDSTYRSDFFRLLHGVAIPKSRRDEIQSVLTEILKGEANE